MSPWLRLLFVSASWLLALRKGGWLLAALLPTRWLSQLSLPGFSMLVQALATAVGLGLTFALVRKPREVLGIVRPSKGALAKTLLVAPALFVATSVLALQIAMPWLLEEIEQGRVHASRENAGAMGQALQEAPLLSTLLWAALLAGVTEELFFRGALFTLVRNAVRRVKSNAERMAGAVAVVASAALFGFAHADMPGGVGVVRIVSSVCLGLACGLARLTARSLWAPILLHTTNNVLALAVARKWLDDGSAPLVFALPNRLLALAGVGLIVMISLTVSRMLMSRRPHFE